MGGTEKKREPVAALTQIILVFLPEDTFQVWILHQRSLGEYKEGAETPVDDKIKYQVL